MRAAQLILTAATGTAMLAGCGAAASAPPVVARVTSQQLPHASSPVASPRPVAPSSAPPPVTHPAAAPVIHMYVVESTDSNTTATLRIVDPGGRVLAATSIPIADEWLTAAGPGGAYWLDRGELHVLSAGGSVRTLASVPAAATGLLIAPDGGSFAYSLASPATAAGVIRNQILVAPFGGRARVIADRTADPSHPRSDAPQSWTYLLDSWTSQGIVFVRDPYGGCGCGPFDMQMQAAYTGVIDPAGDTVVDLTSDGSCPLSGIGPARSIACFQSSAVNQSLRVQSGSGVTRRFALPAKTIGGDARFSPDGTALAYVTEVQTSDAGCGGTWRSTLRILSLGTGTMRSVSIDDLDVSAWPSSGTLLGTVSGQDSWSLVGIDTASLRVHTVWRTAGTAHLVGLT